MTFLTLERIHKSYGAVKVLRGVDLAIQKGSFVALLGGSGSGKTTILRMIAGLEQVQEGAIRIGGEDVTDLPPERRQLSMMFQSYALFPHMSVLDNVRFPMRMQRKLPPARQKESAIEALRLVKLDHLADRAPRALSGGQQQRVALARSIVSQPRVLLLDEPLSNLDARLREDMQIELQEIHRKLGLTTIFVTHDQEEALSLADRVILLRNGTIVRDDLPDSLYDQPRTEFAADFLGAGNILQVSYTKRDADTEIRFKGGQSVTIPAHHSEPTGQLLLRQEDLSLIAGSDRPVSNLVGLKARIVARIFLGSRVRYVVDTGEFQLRILMPRKADFPVGSDVQAVWSPLLMRWLAATDTAQEAR